MAVVLVEYNAKKIGGCILEYVWFSLCSGLCT
jgi:hypothetical protein